MNGNEFSVQFDLLFNNITSNQAPGLNEFEKSSFLTKAQDELIKNYFLPQSNPKQAGFDGNPKRQMDFSALMCTEKINEASATNTFLNPRGMLYKLPKELFILINETLQFITTSTINDEDVSTVAFQRQVTPVSYLEYSRLMNKPYKEPLKNQAWRLLTNAENSERFAEIIARTNDLDWLKGDRKTMEYIVRYVRQPRPIIIAPLTAYGVTIRGKNGTEEEYHKQDTNNPDTIDYPCELDESLHEEIVQRAVELAKVAWFSVSGDGVQTMIQVGQRSE